MLAVKSPWFVGLLTFDVSQENHGDDAKDKIHAVDGL